MLETPISDKKYFAYVTVQHSGLTNMFDVNQVIRLSKRMAGISLTKEDIMQIMKNYSELEKLYDKKI